MPYQPTREDIERVRAAQQAQAEASARIAEAQLQHTVATMDLDHAIDILINGPRHHDPLSVTGPSQHPRTQDRPAEHPSP